MYVETLISHVCLEIEAYKEAIDIKQVTKVRPWSYVIHVLMKSDSRASSLPSLRRRSMSGQQPQRSLKEPELGTESRQTSEG